MTQPLRAVLRPSDLGDHPLELDTDASIGRRTVGIGGIVWRPGKRLEAWSERLAGRRLPGNGELLALEVGLRRVAALVGAEPLRAWTDSQAAIAALLLPRTPLDKAILAAAEAFPALVVEWVPRWCLVEVDMLSKGLAARAPVPSCSVAERLRAQFYREIEPGDERRSRADKLVAKARADSANAMLPPGTPLTLKELSAIKQAITKKQKAKSGIEATFVRRLSGHATLWRITFLNRPPLFVDYGGCGHAVRRVFAEAPE